MESMKTNPLEHYTPPHMLLSKELYIPLITKKLFKLALTECFLSLADLEKVISAYCDLLALAALF